MKILLRRRKIFLPLIFAYCLLSLLCLLLFVNTQHLLLLSFRSSWFFCMIFMPGLALCSTVIDKATNSSVIRRFPTRLLVLKEQRNLHDSFNLFYLTVWFLLLLIVGRLRFGPLEDWSMLELADDFLRDWLCITMFSNLLIALRYSPYKWLSSAPAAWLYVLVVAEFLAVVPALNRNFFSIDIYLLFGWKSFDSPWAYVPLCGINLILLAVHRFRTAKLDVL